MKKANIYNSLSPKSNDFYVMGNYLSSNLTYLEVNFSRWLISDSNGNPCQTDADITNAVNNAGVAILLLNTFYNFDNFTQPITTYFDDQIFFYLINDYSQEANVYIRENSAEQLDSIFRYSSNGDQSTFISKSKFIY